MKNNFVTSRINFVTIEGNLKTNIREKICLT